MHERVVGKPPRGVGEQENAFRALSPTLSAHHSASPCVTMDLNLLLLFSLAVAAIGAAYFFLSQKTGPQKRGKVEGTLRFCLCEASTI